MKRLRVASFNVEGLKRKLEDEDFLREIYKYDIIVLVETWLPVNQNESVHVEGFFSFSTHRKKNPRARRSSGGISVLVRTCYRKGIKFLQNEREEFLWCKLEKEYFGLLEDIYLCATYIPPYNSTFHYNLLNTNHENSFDVLQKQLLYFSKLYE